jgi:hypothetical protein
LQFLIMLCLASAILGGCLFDCGDTINLEKTSPEQKYVATVFERDCGATTDYSTIVVLRRFKRSFDPESGRIFIVKGRVPVTLTWTDPNRLLVKCPECAPEGEMNKPQDKVFKREKEWNGVSISYAR